MPVVAVPGPHHLDDRAFRRIGVRAGGHGLVPGRIEAGPEVIAPREAEAGQEVEGLPADRADAVDDRTGIGLRVLQRPVEVVDHRQPALGDLGLRALPGLAHLPGAPLAHVVQLGHRAQPLILQFGDARRVAAVPGTAIPGAAVRGPGRPGVGWPGAAGLRIDNLGVDHLCVDRLGVDGLGALAALTHGW